MTPKGHAEIQSRHPLQTSDWMTTVLNSVPILGELLDELHVTPVGTVQAARVVVAVATHRAHAAMGAGKLVPLLAGDLARLAADADGGVRVESHGLGHVSLRSERLGFLDVADEGFSFVNRDVRLADERRQLIDDVAFGEALVSPVPGHADLMDDLA